MLAGVSTDYYIRLEQGREHRPSVQVLESLADALRLDPDATAYLYELVHPRTRPRGRVGPSQRVNPGLLRILNSWNHTPAFVLGSSLNVLATNRLIEALYAGMTYTDNCLRMLFMSPEAQHLYADWEKVARGKVANLRATAVGNPGDPTLARLVDELSAHSEEFRRLWARHDVRPMSNDVKKMRHHEVGELTLAWESLTVNAAPCQQLVVMTAEPGSPSERALATLGRISAATGRPPSSEPRPDPETRPWRVPSGAPVPHREAG